MKILAINDEMRNVSVDDFFSKFTEFSENHELIEQTSRLLKVLSRHPDDLEIVAKSVEDGYTITVGGVSHVYTILFEIRNDSIILKNVQ